MYYNDNGELIKGRKPIYATKQEAKQQYNQNRKDKPGYVEYNRERVAKWAKDNREKANDIKRRSREKNKEKEQATAKIKRDSRRQLLWTAKDKPCMDCGFKFNPWQMDFDHRPNELKLNDVSKMICVNIEKLIDEIAKCDVVCSNCHRNRTHLRGY